MRDKKQIDRWMAGKAVHCPDEESAKAVLAVANRAGYRWISGDSCRRVTEWDDYKGLTCYRIEKQGVGYCRLPSVERLNLRIISPQDFIDYCEGLDPDRAEYRKALESDRGLAERIYAAAASTGLTGRDPWDSSRLRLLAERSIEAASVFREVFGEAMKKNF